MEGLKPIEVEINGTHYTIPKLTGTKALVVWNRLIKIAAPALAQAAGAVDFTHPTLEHMNVEKLGAALAAHTSSLTDVELLGLKDELLAGLRANNQEVTRQTFDVLFAGDVETPLRLMFAAVKGNFGGFFGLGNLLQRLQTRVGGLQFPSPNSSVTSGPSGA